MLAVIISGVTGADINGIYVFQGMKNDKPFYKNLLNQHYLYYASGRHQWVFSNKADFDFSDKVSFEVSYRVCCYSAVFGFGHPSLVGLWKSSGNFECEDQPAMTVATMEVCISERNDVHNSCFIISKGSRLHKCIEGTFYRLYRFSTFSLDCSPPQSEVDALGQVLEEGFKKLSVTCVREVISLLEARGHDCADAKAKLKALVSFAIDFVSCFFFVVPVSSFSLALFISLYSTLFSRKQKHVAKLEPHTHTHIHTSFSLPSISRYFVNSVPWFFKK